MKKVGLALGGGGARGWAHIGVIEALEEAGVRVSYVAGASMGALVGGAYAAGKLPLLREFALQLDWKQVLYYFLEVNFPRSGLIDGTRIAAFVRQQVSRSNIESLPLPFATVATDVMTGREVVMKKGDLIEAIRASISIPGIFTPVNREGAVLVDGGLVNPVPVSVAREMGADFVIAVDLNQGALGRPRRPKARAARPAAQRLESARRRAAASNPLLKRIDDKIRQFDVTMLKPARKWLSREDLPNVFDVLGNSLRIMEAQIAETRLKIDRPDILIRPPVGRFNFMEFHRADEAIRAGYVAAKEQLAKTPELFKQCLRQESDQRLVRLTLDRRRLEADLQRIAEHSLDGVLRSPRNDPEAHHDPIGGFLHPAHAPHPHAPPSGRQGSCAHAIAEESWLASAAVLNKVGPGGWG